MLEQYTTFNEDEDVINKLDATVTTGIFSNGVGTISTFYTSSAQNLLSSSHYYKHVYDLAATSSVMFDISYGSSSAFGSYADSYEEVYTPAMAIYKQYANICLPTTVTAFTFADKTTGSGQIFAINFAREQFKDGIDAGNWSLTLSGSTTKRIELCDNSNETSPSQPSVGINAGQAYYVVSGSGTTMLGTAAASPMGIVYPKLGLIILDAQSCSLETDISLDEDSAKTNIDLFAEMIVTGSNFVARNEEKVSSTHYFCRIKNQNYNFSNNPTWVTGSAGLMKYSEMYNDPQVYPTMLGLYDDNNQLLATAKLNKPQLKNIERELLVKVRISF